MGTADGGGLVVRLVRTAERHPDGASLLRAAAAELLAVAPDEVLVEREPSGRPRLGGAAAGLHASVSHVPGLSAVAVSRVGAVGVDVERLRPLPAAALARRWFTTAESRWVAARPQEEQPAAFLGLWTQKEAVGKALGTGLSRGGTRRPVRLGAVPGTELLPVPAGRGMRTALPDPPEGFVLAVAAGPDAAGVRVEVLTPVQGPVPRPAAPPGHGGACPSRSGGTRAAGTSGAGA
ncbi:4'-phosphopantetheinyl transferase family protein [Streptomyces sp. NPDC090077]|uniref:4'-phosphopantetheinyl transferase family protein n=1 Tax=Streptomyces sp. NPDC090077 TaxID=3365938 RepID=UPI00381FDA82